MVSSTVLMLMLMLTGKAKAAIEGEKHHQHQDQALEETSNKKYTKIKCSGSLYGDT